MDSSGPLIISGKVSHTSPESCTVFDGINSVGIDDGTDFSLNQGFVEESYEVTITATCGVLDSIGGFQISKDHHLF